MFSGNVPINDVPPYTQAIATGGQTVFSTTWTANVASDVVVYQTPAGSSPNDITQILPYPSAYSVAFIGGLDQVQVTLVTGANAGDIVTITRMTPANRLNLYSDTNFTPTMLNNDFGILTLVDQQAQLVNQQIGPRYNYSATIDITPARDTILPILAPNEIWIMNAAGTAIIAAEINNEDSGTVNIGLMGQIAYYNLTGNVLSGANLVAGAGISIALVGNDYTITGTGGTVISITANNGLDASPNPIVGTGSIGLHTIATLTGLVNTTGGPAVPVATTLTAWLDAAIGSTQGDLLYRNSTGWVVLAPGTSGQLLQTLGASANPAYTTATYPTTTTINQLLWSSSANVVVGLATANSGVLITSAGGVPSISSALPGGLTVASDPTVPLGIATKQYVDLNALNGTSVYAASTGTLGTVTQSGAGVGATITNAGVQAVFALDSASPPTGSLVLIKNTATGMTSANEGVYTVTDPGSIITNWVLTRATTYDTPTDINDTGLIVVQNGSTLAGTAWYNVGTIVTVDTTAFNYAKFGNNGTVTSVGTSGLATGGTITSTGTINVPAASSAQQVTGTSNSVAVTPGVQANHPSAAKIWGLFKAVDGSINSAYNVTSVTKNSTGNYTVNFSITLGNGNYAVVLTPTNNTTLNLATYNASTQTTTAFTILTFNTSFAAADPANVSFAVFCNS